MWQIGSNPETDSQPDASRLRSTATVYLPEGVAERPPEAVADVRLVCDQPWFALFVRSRHEKSVQRILDYKGYQTSVPLQKCRHVRRCGSNWENEKPLISGYVFVRHDPQNRFRIVTTPGILHIVGFGGQPSAIPVEEIQALQRIAASPFPAGECIYPGIGDAVKLVGGPLTGLEGIVTRERSATRLVVNVPMLQRSVAVEIDVAWVVRVQSASERRPVSLSARATLK